MTWRVKHPKINKLRAINDPDSSIGRKRQNLYKGASTQAKAAYEQGFYIEAIAISESIITDRLEARRAYLADNDVSKRWFRTIGPLLDAVAKDDPVDDRKLISAYIQIQEWEPKRNSAIHELVKLREDRTDDLWGARYESLKSAAEEGLQIAKAISAAVKRLNKYPKT
jgi:hypothetical protein